MQTPIFVIHLSLQPNVVDLRYNLCWIKKSKFKLSKIQSMQRYRD